MRTITIPEFNKAVNQLIADANIPSDRPQKLSEDILEYGIHYHYLRFGKGWGYEIVLNLRPSHRDGRSATYKIEVNNGGTTRSVKDAAAYAELYAKVAALATAIDALATDTTVTPSPEAIQAQELADAQEKERADAFRAAMELEKAAAKKARYAAAAIKRAATIRANKEREATWQRLQAERNARESAAQRVALEAAAANAQQA